MLIYGLSASRTSAGRDEHHTPLEHTFSLFSQKYSLTHFPYPTPVCDTRRQEVALAAHSMLTSVLGVLGPLVPNATFPGVVTFDGVLHTHTL
jgi:hypothetical protein